MKLLQLYLRDLGISMALEEGCPFQCCIKFASQVGYEASVLLEWLYGIIAIIYFPLELSFIQTMAFNKFFGNFS